MVVAIVVAASAWAFFRGILELSVGLLVVAGLGGWAIGVLVRSRDAHPLLAVALAAIAWLLGLVLSWLLALAILPGSSRTFFERVQATPFLDWMSPQFGFVEVLGLIVYVSLAGYVARRGNRGATTG